MPRRRFPLAGTVTAAALLLAVVVLASATATADAKTKSLASSFLEPHNAARRAVGVPALRWDEGLAAYARWYAAARAGDCALAHSHGAYGENLFRGSGGAGWSPAAVVGAWVRESALYNRASNSCRGGGGACGHYTQIVWRGTKAVGCAMAPCAGARGRFTFAVCSYSPPGNYVGMRPY
ncbi:hypothetical protein BDA96_04G345300 [Sorghum bicolor]|uniref:SCP domain-containing protein n=1 Tax=Sorghum bicolor TaxID=4558 RepID=A0A921UKU9_SORBI|nr:hypothetical protein BDA96_04G345300 [Sorghum bicolor]